MNEPIPDDVRRFVLSNITSVSQLEALLLMRSEAARAWPLSTLAQRLYIAERAAGALLEELCGAAMLVRDADCYLYRPASPEMAATIDALAAAYPRHLIEIARMIHARLDRKAQQFVNAFTLRKDA